MISVIVCTHNPILKNLNRVLVALKNQSLDYFNWELILVDNKSDIPVKQIIEINWHPNYIYIIENELGLVKARIAGIKAASGDFIVFVDDDNILNQDFLEKVFEIGNSKPYLGAFGGASIGEYEINPASELISYLEMIAVRNITAPSIGNYYEWRNTPAGAGLVIRKEVAKFYVNQVMSDNSRMQLDRKGSSLMSSGDIDLSYTSIDLGYLNGLFPELVLTHIIPANRVEKAYFIKLQYYNVLSNNILEYVRFRKWPTGKNWKENLYVQFCNLLKGRFFEFKMEQSRRAGFLASIEVAMQLRISNIKSSNKIF